MTAPTDQFADVAKRSQEAVSAVVRNWSDVLQSWTGAFAAGPKLPDAQAVVDQYFDFAQQVLDNQRAFAQTILTAGTHAAESVTEQAQRVAENVKAHTLHAAEATAEKAEKTTQAARNAKAEPARS